MSFGTKFMGNPSVFRNELSSSQAQGQAMTERKNMSFWGRAHSAPSGLFHSGQVTLPLEASVSPPATGISSCSLAGVEEEAPRGRALGTQEEQPRFWLCSCRAVGAPQNSPGPTPHPHRDDVPAPAPRAGKEEGPFQPVLPKHCGGLLVSPW